MKLSTVEVSKKPWQSKKRFVIASLEEAWQSQFRSGCSLLTYLGGTEIATSLDAPRDDEELTAGMASLRASKRRGNLNLDRVVPYSLTWVVQRSPRILRMLAMT
ncbi:MAG: hypothetical protein ACLFQV_06785, partial [Vulcanimicrobiota bacterium]